jgi:hypothetical protein
VDSSQFFSFGLGDILRRDDFVEVGLSMLIAYALEQTGDEIGLTDLKSLLHGADIEEDLLNYLLRVLEERHQVGHALGNGLLVGLSVALEELRDPLLNDLQILVTMKVRGENSQKDDVADSARFVDKALQHKQQFLSMFLGIPLDDVDTHLHTQLGQRAKLHLGCKLNGQQRKHWLEERLIDGVDVDGQEVRQHLQTLLVEPLIEQLLGCFKHHLEDVLCRLRCYFLFYEQTQFLNSLLRVLLHEFFHVKRKNRILDLYLRGESFDSKFLDFLVGL